MVLYVLLNLFAPMDWVMIFGAILLLFGGKKIPELMRGLGEGVREFNSAKANIKTEIEEGMKQRVDPMPIKDKVTEPASTETK
jgi:sec-independent protein translocase protein TatA